MSRPGSGPPATWAQVPAAPGAAAPARTTSPRPNASGPAQSTADRTNGTHDRPVPDPHHPDPERPPAAAETAYLERLCEGVLDAESLRRHAPRVVFTNLHGTGDAMVIPALRRLGIRP